MPQAWNSVFADYAAWLSILAGALLLAVILQIYWRVNKSRRLALQVIHSQTRIRHRAIVELGALAREIVLITALLILLLVGYVTVLWWLSYSATGTSGLPASTSDLQTITQRILDEIKALRADLARHPTASIVPPTPTITWTAQGGRPVFLAVLLSLAAFVVGIPLLFSQSVRLRALGAAVLTVGSVGLTLAKFDHLLKIEVKIPEKIELVGPETPPVQSKSGACGTVRTNVKRDGRAAADCPKEVKRPAARYRPAAEDVQCGPGVGLVCH
jgi:hypothetical protein